MVKGRSRTIALVETMSSFMRLPEIVKIKGLDSVHIGLNDLSLDLKFDDMFEIVTNEWMEIICENFFLKKEVNFGGISTLNDLGCKYSAKEILKHHKRCNSNSILSRRFFIVEKNLEDRAILGNNKRKSTILKLLLIYKNND